MKTLNLTTLILTIVGGINWGLVGLFNFNLVTALFGIGFFSNLIFVLIGLSALYQILPFSKACRTNEVLAESGARW